MQKFIIVSNYLNHHQIPFCNALDAFLKGSFAFVQTEPVEEERIRMGWKEASVSYLVHYYEEPERGRHMIDEADIVLFGGTDDESYIQNRLMQGKPVIRYSERLYKEAQWKAISPRGLLRKYKDHTRYRKAPVYLLCAGAYVPSDFHIVRAYPGKMLKWGYFPEKKVYDVDDLMKAKETGKILWAARMIDWKHPEIPVRMAKKLKERGIPFHLEMIGGGELETEVRRLRTEYHLEEEISLPGYREPAEVRKAMERADIYLVTSDRREGWGAVVNEAMNSGCAVVADSMIGAAPYLIRPGDNGYVYETGREDQLLHAVCTLLKDREKCQKTGRNAYDTIIKEWNAETAAKRLAAFCVEQGFLRAEDVTDAVPKTAHFTSGPCSQAPVIPERKMYRALQSHNPTRYSHILMLISGQGSRSFNQL